MTHARIDRIAGTIIVCLLTVALAFALAGCNDKAPDKTPQAGTAREGLEVAQSALTTMAPDAKLLVVQTAEAVTPTATPVWTYLFGSPQTDAIFVVYVTDGKSMGASEYGTAGLSAEEWAEVPELDAWTFDSDDAYDKAYAISGAKSTPAAYYMGFQTYVPDSFEGSMTVEPYTWYVSFDPGASGATTSTIAVSAEGEASVLE